MRPNKQLLLLAAFAILCAPVSVKAYDLGIIHDPNGLVDSQANWNWSIRGSTVTFIAIEANQALPNPSNTPIIVLEDACISDSRRREFKRWLNKGGILILSGLKCLESKGILSVEEWRANIAGLSVQDAHVGLDGVYPRIVSSSPIL